MRAISAPTSAARFSKFSGQFSAQIFELPMVRGQGFEMLSPLRRPAAESQTRRGQARRRNDIRLSRTTPATSRAAVAPSMQPLRWPGHSRQRRSAPAASGSSTSTRRAPRLGFSADDARSEARSNCSSSKQPNFGVRPRSVRMSASCAAMNVDNETEPRSSARTRARFRPRAAPRRADRRRRAGSCSGCCGCMTA